MALQITKKKEVGSEEEDILPDNEPTEKIDRERALELELAEKKGELKALQKTVSSSANQPMSLEQTKQLVYADINNLSDEDFQKKYNQQSKHAVSMTVMDADNRQTKAEARRDRAEAHASVQLSAKYADIGRYMDQIQENLGDLSEEARQDPEKLRRFMERQYLALSKEESSVTLKKDNSRRKIASDFEKPTVVEAKRSEGSIENDEIVDEIPAESDISNQKLANLMGIRSEKERKALSEKNAIYVDMNLGDGWHFADPKKGFIKEVRQVA